MPITNVDDFFEALEKCSLLSTDEVQSVRRQMGGVGDPKQVARKLMLDGQLTKWQALQLLHGRTTLTMGPYQLLDQLSGDAVNRTFLARHRQTGRQGELQALSRSHTSAHPEAVDEFVARAEKAAAADNRALLDVHRPESSADVCYVVLAESADKLATDAEPSAAARVRPPKLKPKAAPTGAESQGPTADSTAPQTPAAAEPKPSAPSDASETPTETPAAQPAETIKIELPGSAQSSLAAAAPQEFKIAAGKRRKTPRAAPAKTSQPAAAKEANKKPAKPTATNANLAEARRASATAEAIPEAEPGDDSPAPASPAERRLVLSPAVLIGGGAAVVLLLVIGIAGAWLLLSGRKATPVAQADTPRTVASQSAGTEAAEGSEPKDAAASAPEPADSEPSDPISDPVVDPVVTVEAAEPAVSGASPATDAASSPSSPPAEPSAAMDAAAPAAAQTVASPAPVTAGDKPADAAEAKPALEPAMAAAEAKSEESASETSDQAESKPDAKNENQAEAKAEKEEKEKPADDKAAKKKEAAAPKAKKPFADLKDFAALPEPTSAEPQTLGAVHIPPEQECYIKLRGGDKAMRGAQRFVLKNAREGLAERDWEVSICEASGAETVIATLQIDDQSHLVFQWKPEARSAAFEGVSPHFRNCVLSLACAGDSKTVTLREPVTGEPFSVEFDKATGSKGDWKIPFCPNPEAVRFEITSVEGAKITVDPKESQPADKTTVWIRIEEGGGLLSVKLDSLLKRDFVLNATPHVKLSADQPKPDKFNRRLFQAKLKELELNSQQAATMLENMQMFIKSPAPEAKRKQVEQQMPTMEFDTKTLAQLVANLKKIDALTDKVKDGMKIKFRVFFDADSTEVTLLKGGA